MTGPKTNERQRQAGAGGNRAGAGGDRAADGYPQGTRAVHRHARVSAYKVREVLDLIRNKPIAEADEIVRFSERDAAMIVFKVLQSAVANAANNDGLDPEELYVSACFADEGTTIKRWRPRARGRATRIRKRTCHITVIVSRLPSDRLERLAARRRADIATQRARRVAGARRSEVREGDSRSRADRRRRGEDQDTSAAEAAAGAEEQGIVEATAGAVAAADAGETPVTAADTEERAQISDTDAGRIAAAEDEAGIVDPQAPAVAASEAAASEAGDRPEAEERSTDEGSE